MPDETEHLSLKYRASVVDLSRKRLLITNFLGSEQEQDLTVPPNCNGFGRIRHFRRETGEGWPLDPLPNDPACKSLGLPPTDVLRAQVFQIAACNFKCWYCFVPEKLLQANDKHAAWIGPAELVDLYLKQPNSPFVIDLTGGQPDLVPEWVPWMMEEIRSRGLEEQVYLWSDDNLSNNYFWKYLRDEDLQLLTTYSNYGRVCCFKGFNAESFNFNTGASPELFKQQFILFEKLLKLGIDIYAYTTFTAPSRKGITDDICRFVDLLQGIDENLPLRTVPLEIKVYAPVKHRLDKEKLDSIDIQKIAVEAWQRELENRFTHDKRTRNIADVTLKGSR